MGTFTVCFNSPPLRFFSGTQNPPKDADFDSSRRAEHADISFMGIGMLVKEKGDIPIFPLTYNSAAVFRELGPGG